MTGFELLIVESVVVSDGRVSAVVVVVDEFVDVDADEVAAADTSTALCDTGSTIANGFLWRFSACPVGAGGGGAAYGFACGIFCGSEG